MERLTSALRLLGKSFGAQFLVALLFILVLKWDAVARPPVWDTAMGLFPAAITLADNGFDVIELLGMPDFFEGGPNTHGALYPLDIDTEGPGNDPLLTERSNAYRRLQSIQMEAVRFLEALPEGTPVYYGHYEHYLLSYPELGYASAPLSNGHNFSVESLAELVRAESFPPCVYTLFNYPWSGGEKIRGLIRFAAESPDRSSEIVREFRDGRYVIVLVLIRNGDAVCPS